MVELDFDSLELSEDNVKKVLDDSASAYVKTVGVTEIMRRNYNLVDYEIEITEENKNLVKDFIYALTAWQVFGSYGTSVNESTPIQNSEGFSARLGYYKEIANLYAVNLGIDINKTTGNKQMVPLIISDVGHSEFEGDY